MGTWEEIKGNTSSIISLKRYGLIALLLTAVIFIYVNIHEQSRILTLSDEIAEMKREVAYVSAAAMEATKMWRVGNSNGNNVKPSMSATRPKVEQKPPADRVTDPRKFHITNTGTNSKHLMLEVFNASQTKLNDEKYIRSLFSQIISKLGMTEVSMSSVAMVPQGVSAVALLTESHMSIHTWPELGYAAIDVFTCGPTNPLDALSHMAEGFEVKKPERDMLWAYIDRGKTKEEGTDLSVMKQDLYAEKVLVAAQQSKYQRVEIWEMKKEMPAIFKNNAEEFVLDENKYDKTYRDADGVVKNNRCFFLDGVLMSCLADERAYHESLIHPAMVAHSNPKRVAVLGGAEGASLREILKHTSVEKAYMLELDEVGIDMCKKYLPTMSDGAFQNPKTDVRVGDAAKFFKSSPDASDLDILFLDVLDIDAAPPELQASLAGPEFVTNMQRSLSEDGIIVVQMGMLTEYQIHNSDDKGLYGPQVSFMLEMLKQFKYASAYDTMIPSFLGSWMYLVVTDSEEVYRRMNFRTASEMKIDMEMKMSDPDKILRVVNEHTLAQMKGVPAVLSKTLCEPPLSDSITYRDEITVLKVEEAKEVCEWVIGEVSDEGINVFNKKSAFTFDPLRTLLVGRKSPRRR